MVAEFRVEHGIILVLLVDPVATCNMWQHGSSNQKDKSASHSSSHFSRTPFHTLLEGGSVSQQCEEEIRSYPGAGSRSVPTPITITTVVGQY